jgi:hypothetical protein
VIGVTLGMIFGMEDMDGIGYIGSARRFRNTRQSYSFITNTSARRQYILFRLASELSMVLIPSYMT